MLKYSVPAVAASYHLRPVPVAVKAATVGEAPEQNDCAAVPVGAPGVVLTVAVTDALEAVVHVPDVAST